MPSLSGLAVHVLLRLHTIDPVWFLDSESPLPPLSQVWIVPDNHDLQMQFTGILASLDSEAKLFSLGVV